MKGVIEDLNGVKRAEIKIDSIQENLFCGEIIKNLFSKNQQLAFNNLEELVNNQVLSLIDEAEEKINSFGFIWREKNRRIVDFQIYNGKDFSFKCFI